MHLRTKFTLISVGIILFLALTAVSISWKTFADIRTEEMHARGNALALQAVQKTLPALSSHNLLEAQAQLTTLKKSDPSIAYVFITNARGVVAQAQPVSPEIIHANGPSLEHATNTLMLQTPEGTIHDIAYPVGTKGTLRMGLISPPTSYNYLPKGLVTIIIFVLASAAIALAAAYHSTHPLPQPIKQLYTAAHQLSEGNFKAKANIQTNDELQELGTVFDTATEALSKLDEERKQIDQAKTRFLSITSHELRSPMTPMKAQLQMLEQGYYGKLNKKQKDGLQVIMRNADRLDTIIADFLEISRIEAARLKFNFKKTDVAKTAREVISYMQGFMPKKHIIITEKFGKLPIIETDPDRLTQVLRNLLSNAVKFSKEKTTVLVTAQLERDFIRFSVKDQGVGISPKDQLKLFEPFFQAEQTMYRGNGGNGLGLAICRGIVLSQNGKIWLESAVGKGTTFFFTLPLKPVKEIKPIRVLFSTKDQIEKKLAELFSELLGPIGASEFEDLRQESLSRDQILSYIDELKKKGILTRVAADEFKYKANHLFLMVDSHRGHNLSK